MVDTAAGVTGRAAQDKIYLPALVMEPPFLWLVSDESNAHNGKRLVANLWDKSLPLDERTEAARQSGVDAPRIV